MANLAKWNLFSKTSLPDYTELRVQENRSLNIAFLNGQLTTNTQSSRSGVSARSFKNGAWGFASHPTIASSSLEKVLLESQLNAKNLASRSKSSGSLLKLAGSNGHYDGSTKRSNWSSEELLERIKLMDAFLQKKYPALSSRGIDVFQQDFIKEGYTSDGANTYSHYARSYFSFYFGLNSENGPVEVEEVLGGKGQIEDTFPTEVEIAKAAEELYRHVVNKSKGINAEAGLKEVILHPKLAGILAHEAIGHTTEADLVLGGSIAGEFLNTQVASTKVNLVDFAHHAFGEEAPMPVYFDDEGVNATDTVIIENGVLKTFMNSRESAEHFHMPATGHARAWGFNDEPLIRMRNTAILPGGDSLEDMIASIKDGYYLIDHGNGQADSTSEFMFAVPLGYEIKNGKLGRALMDTTISGVAFDMLKTVDAVSKDMTWISYGTCGKKQPMTVGMGGPAIKCKVNIGGK